MRSPLAKRSLANPKQTKPVCQWYAKGNCRFGAKCALAHILPGQPMSFDRKNKRAAQAAQREQAGANGNGNGSGNGNGNGTSLQQPSTSPTTSAGDNLEHHQSASPTKPPPQQPPSQGSSGLARSLQNSLDLGNASLSTLTSSPSLLSSNQNSWTAHQSPSLPPPTSRALPLPPQQATATFVVPPSSGLSQTLHHLSSASAQNSFAQPTTTNRRSLPVQTHSSHSPPNGNGATIFGTSPFSASRSLFMPTPTAPNASSSSYGSSGAIEEPTSPPFFGAPLPPLTTRRESNFSPSSWTETSNLSYRANKDEDLMKDLGAEEQGDEEDGEEGFDQAFLPSSLSELLTPEELRRRRNKGAVGGGTSSWDPWGSSRSVPAEMMMLSRGGPSGSVTRSTWASGPPSGVAPSSSSPSPSSSYQHASYHPPPSTLATPPLAPRTLLPPPTSPPLTSNHHLRPQYQQYSASFDPSTNNLISSSSNSFHRSPSQANTSHQYQQLGSSLPGGLAAGLSQLHLIPATSHFGDTPPSSHHSPSGYYNTTGPTMAISPPTNRSVWNGSAISWGSEKGINGGHMPTTLAAQRRLSSHLSSNGNGMGSPLRSGNPTNGFHHTHSHGGYEDQDGDDIQFNLDIEI